MDRRIAAFLFDELLDEVRNEFSWPIEWIEKAQEYVNTRGGKLRNCRTIEMSCILDNLLGAVRTLEHKILQRRQFFLDDKPECLDKWWNHDAKPGLAKESADTDA
jgi:hypothetical protein